MTQRGKIFIFPNRIQMLYVGCGNKQAIKELGNGEKLVRWKG